MPNSNTNFKMQMSPTKKIKAKNESKEKPCSVYRCVFIQQKKFSNDRIMRWSLQLQPYRMTIEAIPGKDNLMADYLSRSTD